LHSRNYKIEIMRNYKIEIMRNYKIEMIFSIHNHKIETIISYFLTHTLIIKYIT
jgi:hypothetical protein